MSKKTSITNISRIAKIYAEALAENFHNNADINIALTELEAIKEVFASNKDLVLVLEHPSVKLEEKKDLVSKIFSGKVQESLVNLMLILLDRGRLNIVSVLPKYFKKIVFEQQNTEIATVNSANPLDEAQLNEIKSKLEAIFNKKLQMETKIDESLIAGVKVNIGDKVLDSSVKSKLKQMKQLLTA